MTAICQFHDFLCFRRDTSNVHKATADFNFCVSLDTLLEFCEDYKCVVVNARHDGCILPFLWNLNWSCTMFNDRYRTLQWNNYSWVCCVFPRAADRSAWAFDRWGISTNLRRLQATTRHTWTVKEAVQAEKPRYVTFDVQISRENIFNKRAVFLSL